MRYCGNCGVPLYEASLTAGHCLSCGTAITMNGDVATPSQAEWIAQQRREDVPSDYRTTQPQLEPTAYALSDAAPDVSDRELTAPTHVIPVASVPADASAQSRHRRLLGFFLLGGGSLFMVILIFLFLNRASSPVAGNSTAGIFPPGGNGGSSRSTSTKHQTPAPGQTPLPGIQATGTANPMGTPAATGTPNATGTPQPSPTPGGPATPTPQPGITPTPVPVTPVPSPTPIPTSIPGTPAAITLSPTSASNLLCLNSSTNFYIVNSGGSPLNWTASIVSGSYTLSPQASGTLASDAQQGITVSGISGSGKIQVSDPAAPNSPQFFTITCTL